MMNKSYAVLLDDEKSTRTLWRVVYKTDTLVRLCNDDTGESMTKLIDDVWIVI